MLRGVPHGAVLAVAGAEMLDSMASDALVLCALTIGVRAEGSAWLQGLVGAYEHLNCCLPTLEEINGALDRLVAAGLVNSTENGLVAAESVRSFHATIAALPARTLVPHFEAFVRRELVRGATSQDLAAPAVTEAELRAAEEDYRRSVRPTRSRLHQEKPRST